MAETPAADLRKYGIVYTRARGAQPAAPSLYATLHPGKADTGLTAGQSVFLAANDAEALRTAQAIVQFAQQINIAELHITVLELSGQRRVGQVKT